MRFNHNGRAFHATATITELACGRYFYRTMFIFNKENENNALIIESGYMDGNFHEVNIIANNTFESLKVNTFKEAMQIVDLIV